MLLNLLQVRLIVNDREIYSLSREKPVVIAVDLGRSKLVASDGYHFTKPQEVVFKKMNTCYFKVVCAIDDNLLAAGSLILVLFYMVGLISSIEILKYLSFMPILYFLYLYYINRKDFIQIRQV